MGQLSLHQVTKTFDATQVIAPTDLDIEDGEFVVFVGPSGCGKSTMLRMIAGLERVSSGDIAISDKVVNDLPPVDRGISMVFQSYALYPHLSVYENIAFPLRVARLPRDEIEKRVRDVSRVLQLEERLNHKPGMLSGGQRQRVAIGRAIVREPEVFLFDEPLSNLDASLRAEMRLELSRLHQRLKSTMIYVTHDQVEAMTMADKIVVLRGGVIEQVGSPLELYHRPANLFVAGFIGNPTMNFLPATCLGAAAEGVKVRLADGPELVVPVDGSAEVGEELTLGIRPNSLRIDIETTRLELVTDVVEHLGDTTLLYTTDASGRAVCATGNGSVGMKPQQKLTAGFDPADAYLFRADGTALQRRAEILGQIAQA